MKDTGKEDLRVIRTKEAIRKTFEEMICEMIMSRSPSRS